LLTLLNGSLKMSDLFTLLHAFNSSHFNRSGTGSAVSFTTRFKQRSTSLSRRLNDLLSGLLSTLLCALLCGLLSSKGFLSSLCSTLLPECTVC
jgi:hypothetical protein